MVTIVNTTPHNDNRLLSTDVARNHLAHQLLKRRLVRIPSKVLDRTLWIPQQQIHFGRAVVLWIDNHTDRTGLVDPDLVDTGPFPSDTVATHFEREFCEFTN